MKGICFYFLTVKINREFKKDRIYASCESKLFRALEDCPMFSILREKSVTTFKLQVWSFPQHGVGGGAGAIAIICLKQ